MSSIIQPQLEEQVTSVTTALSNPFLTPVRDNQSQCRRGKAPPIDEFTGEDNRVTFDDWLPILERAATSNGWTQEEMLMQLAGHLRGWALQEWKLLNPTDKTTHHSTIKALRERLDPRNQNLTLLDFRHTSQRSSETVSDFLRRLKQLYQTAFGRENTYIT